MYLGRIVEEGRVEEIYSAPAHPYTRALLAAAPRMDKDGVNADAVPGGQLAGEVPSPMAPPAGCPFHTRCPHARPECAVNAPEWRELSGSHRCRCHYPIA
jgi:peptide/nickel transport system ATP-binding protein